MTVHTTGSARTVKAGDRCALAPDRDVHVCVGDPVAVTLAVGGQEPTTRLTGCVLHAAIRLADNPPSIVWPTCPPPARQPYLLAALELARVITSREYEDLTATAVELWIVYVGVPSWW